MENRLPSGYFFKNGIPTSENIRAWIYYFSHGGHKDDTKINKDAFKKVQEVMEWKSEKNGLVCFLWGLDGNAKNSKNTGDYAEMMINTKNLAWDIYLYQCRKVGELTKQHYIKIRDLENEFSDYKFIYEFNNRLIESGDIRFFYSKLTERGRYDMYFNYGKYNGRSVFEIMDVDMNYMLWITGKKSDISDWVKADLLEFIIPRLEKRKNQMVEISDK
jgi:hypothetical protein